MTTTDNARAKCARDVCSRRVSALSPWHPFCSNECEQMAQSQAARSLPQHQVVSERARQLDLESARPWQPKQWPIGTLESALGGLFEAHPGWRYSRDQLATIGRSAMGKCNERNVMEAIREMRRAGWPIISSSGEEGYWLSWEPSDLDQLEQTLRGRSLDMLKTLSAVRRARGRVGRVPVLDDVIEQMERGEL